jgi:hypothetical protein
MTPIFATVRETSMLHKALRLILLNVAVTIVVIAAGHALSYLFG